MKCYNCGKHEIIENGFSDIDRIETNLEASEEEEYMPLCPNCVVLWKAGRLDNIEDNWIKDSNKYEFILLDLDT